MRENRVKRTLAAGGTVIGTTVFEFATTGIGRIAAGAGADFVMYDLEHTAWSIETIRMLMATTRAADTVPMVRVPATQYHLIAGPLDAGAMGIMVPMVESAEEARLIVESAKYPPKGKRGYAFGISHDDYSGGDVLAKMRSANDEGFLVAMIETPFGVKNAAEIAAVEGIDCLWVGHFDLTTTMGIPAQFDHPAFLEAIDTVVAACSSAGKAAGTSQANVEVSREWMKRGFRALSYSIDIPIYQRALDHGIAALKANDS